MVRQYVVHFYLTASLFSWPQSTSNVWMTHAEMESLNAATKPPVSAPAVLSLSDKPSFMFFIIILLSFELFWVSRLVWIMLMSLSPSSSSSLCLCFSFWISFFVGPGHSVEHLLLSLWLPFQCELLPTNYPFTNTLFLPFFLFSCYCCCSLLLCFSSIMSPCSSPLLPFPSPPPHLSLSGSASLCLPLLSALQELKEFSWDQVRITCAFFFFFEKSELTQHHAYLSTILSVVRLNSSESWAADLHYHQTSSGAWISVDHLWLSPPDTGLWRYESRVGGQRLAAQPGPATVSQLFHGVPGGCTHVGPPDQEGAERTAQNGGQLPQVELGVCMPTLASFTAL